MKGRLWSIKPKSVEHLLSAFVRVQLDDVHYVRTARIVRVINVHEISWLEHRALNTSANIKQ